MCSQGQYSFRGSLHILLSGWPSELSGQRLCWLALRPLWLTLKSLWFALSFIRLAFELVSRPREKASDLSDCYSEPSGRPKYGWIEGQMEFFPIPQDFVPCQGRCITILENYPTAN